MLPVSINSHTTLTIARDRGSVLALVNARNRSEQHEECKPTAPVSGRCCWQREFETKVGSGECRSRSRLLTRDEGDGARLVVGEGWERGQRTSPDHRMFTAVAEGPRAKGGGKDNELNLLPFSKSRVVFRCRRADSDSSPYMAGKIFWRGSVGGAESRDAVASGKHDRPVACLSIGCRSGGCRDLERPRISVDSGKGWWQARGVPEHRGTQRG